MDENNVVVPDVEKTQVDNYDLQMTMLWGFTALAALMDKALEAIANLCLCDKNRGNVAVDDYNEIRKKFGQEAADIRERLLSMTSGRCRMGSSELGTVPVTLDEGAYMPTRAHPNEDAGLDLYSRETKVVPAHGNAEFATGVHMQLPHGYCGMIMSKSGLNRYHDIICTGLNDEGFTGEIVAKLYNLGDDAYTVRAGDKITQVAIVPCLYCEPYQVDEIAGGERGEHGYGSTGR